MSGNTLQAMLDRAQVPAETQTSKSRREATATKASVQKAKDKTNPGRAFTKLIGGHFAPEVSTQLRILAAEENTTIQNLLAEALSDLFVKKGKSRITSL